MLKTRKFIVWDWNGTVVADEEASLQAFNATLRLRNRAALDIEAWREAFDMPLTKFYANVGFKEEELDEHIMTMTETFHSHFETFAAQSLLRKGWKEAVVQWGDRNFDNIILSNHLIPSIKSHAARLGIAQDFDHILANVDQAEQLSKLPKGERLRLYIEHQGLSAHNAIIIGDTPEEAHIGKKLGITSVLISGGYATQVRLEAAQPHYLIQELSELGPILHERGFTL